MEFDEPLNSASDYVRRIKSGSGFSLRVPPEHLAWEEGTTNHLPVYIFDRDNTPVPAHSVEDIFAIF